MRWSLALAARPGARVSPQGGLPTCEMRRRRNVERRDLRARCGGKFSRGNRDDRHRDGCDPGQRDARQASPGQATTRTSEANCADDCVHIAQSRQRIAHRRILGQAGLPELSHAVVEMVLELPHEAATLQPPATQ